MEHQQNITPPNNKEKLNTTFHGHPIKTIKKLGEGAYGTVTAIEAYQLTPHKTHIKGIEERAVKIFAEENSFKGEQILNSEASQKINSQNIYDQISAEFVTTSNQSLDPNPGPNYSKFNLVFDLNEGGTLLQQIVEECNNVNNFSITSSAKYLQTIKKLMMQNNAQTIQNKSIEIAQIAAGLHNLHFHKIIHRDIKLQNTMLNKEGNIRIIDLGSGINFSKEETILKNTDYATISHAYCAPIEIFNFIKKYSRKNFSQDAIHELKQILRPTYDIPSIGYLILFIFFGPTSNGKILLSTFINLIRHEDYEGNIIIRQLLCQILQDMSNDVLATCEKLSQHISNNFSKIFGPNLNNKYRYQDNTYSQISFLKEIIASNNEGAYRKYSNLLEYLNNEIPEELRLSPEQVEFLRQACLACFEENSQNRPTAAQIGECFELFAAGCTTDFKQAIQMSQKDRPNTFEQFDAGTDTSETSTPVFESSSTQSTTLTPASPPITEPDIDSLDDSHSDQMSI